MNKGCLVMEKGPYCYGKNTEIDLNLEILFCEGVTGIRHIQSFFNVPIYRKLLVFNYPFYGLFGDK